MNRAVLAKIARVLTRWNPAKKSKDKLTELAAYKSAAADIMFGVDLGSPCKNLDLIVRDVLNEAFELSLTKKDCDLPAGEICSILQEKNRNK